MFTLLTLAFAFSFVLPLLLVRRLSQAEFGLYKQVFLVVGTSIMVLPLGFAMSAYYFLPREPDRQGQVVFNILIFNAVLGVAACLALVLNPGLLARLLNSPAIGPYAPLIGLAILFWMTSLFLETVAVAHQETVLATLFIIAAQLTKTILLVGAAIVFGTVRALVFAALIQGALQTCILLAYLRSRFPRFWRRLDWGMMKTQLAYSLPLGFSGVLFALQNDVHNYFVANRFGAAAFAVYSIGCFELPLVAILGESVGSVMIPRVSLLQKQGARREIILLTARVMRKLAAIFLPIYVLMMVVGREFLVFLFTSSYIASWPILAVNLTLIPVYIVVFDPVVRAFPEHRFFLLRVKILMFVFIFIALWFGTAQLGLVGVIALVVSANIAERAVVTRRMIKALGITRRDAVLLRDVLKIAAAALAAGATAFAVRLIVLSRGPFTVLAVCGVVFALVYLAATFALHVLTTDEQQRIRHTFRRLQSFSRLKSASATLALRE